jgi:DNA replication initiation complex subunit (GINS family)
METLQNLTENEKKVIDLVKDFLEDAAKFRTKGTASAAVRARKGASELSKHLKVVRKELQTDKLVKVAEKKSAEVTSCSGSCACAD